MQIESYIYFGLGANFCFALGTMVFTHFSNKVSSAWMNWFKAFVAIFCFAIAVICTEDWYNISGSALSIFFISGFVGLGIGDWFLLKAFSVLGPGRTLMLFGFQPLFLGAMGQVLFGQEVELRRLISIIFFICCLVTLSLESFRKDRSWGVQGMIFALLGMLLDSSGVLMTRYAFDISPGLSSFQGNFYRCIGAVSVYMLFSLYRPINFFKTFTSFSRKEKMTAIGGSLLGTFISLSFYLKALQTAHLGSLSAINITGTMFTSIFESIILKKKPTIYLFIAFIFFVCGMRFLVF